MAVGRYSQGMIPAEPVCTRLVLLSFTQRVGGMAGGYIGAETQQVLKHLTSVLEEAGSSLNKVLKTTVFLTSMDDFGAMNTVYRGFSAFSRPARSTEQVRPVAKW